MRLAQVQCAWSLTGVLGEFAQIQDDVQVIQGKICGEMSSKSENFTSFHIIGDKIVVPLESKIVFLRGPSLDKVKELPINTNDDDRHKCNRAVIGGAKKCENIITNIIIPPGSTDELYLCGSNSFNPLLYHVKISDNYAKTSSRVFDICPKSYNINSSTLWLASKSSILSIIGELKVVIKVKSIKHDAPKIYDTDVPANHFYDPVFKYIVQTEKRVILFYEEYLYKAPRSKRLPHIASLCLNDAVERSSFLSFTKAELVCKRGDFKFIRLASVNPGKHNQIEGYFGVFNSEFNTFKQSAVCFYPADDIELLFSSTVFYGDDLRRKHWPPDGVKANTSHPKDCKAANTQQMLRESSSFILLADVLSSQSLINSSKYGYFTSIVSHATLPVLLLGTSNGHIVIYTQYNNVVGWTLTQVIDTLTNEAIAKMGQISAAKEADVVIVVSTESVVRSISVTNCDKHVNGITCLNNLFCGLEHDVCVNKIRNEESYSFTEVVGEKDPSTTTENIAPTSNTLNTSAPHTPTDLAKIESTTITVVKRSILPRLITEIVFGSLLFIVGLVLGLICKSRRRSRKRSLTLREAKRDSRNDEERKILDHSQNERNNSNADLKSISSEKRRQPSQIKTSPSHNKWPRGISPSETGPFEFVSDAEVDDRRSRNRPPSMGVKSLGAENSGY